MTKNPRTVLRWVSEKTGLSQDEILSKNRTKRLVVARAQVAKILRNYLGFSYPEIGQFLSRDHSSAMNLVNRIEAIFKPEEILDIND